MEEPLIKILLSDFWPEVTAFEQTFRSYDRQRNVVSYAGGRCIGKEIPGCRFEEIHHRSVFPRWSVRYVNDHRCTLHRVGQSLTGKTIDTRFGRRGYYFLPMLTQLGDEL